MTSIIVLMFVGAIAFQLYLAAEITILADKYDRNQTFWLLFTLFFGIFAAVSFLIQTAAEHPVVEEDRDRV